MAKEKSKMKVELVEVFVALALLRNSEGDKDKGLSQSPKRTTEKSKMRRLNSQRNRYKENICKMVNC